VIMTAIASPTFAEWKIYAWLKEIDRPVSKLQKMDSLIDEYVKKSPCAVTDEDRAKFKKVLSAFCLIKTAQKEPDKVTSFVRGRVSDVFHKYIKPEALLEDDKRFLNRPTKLELDIFSQEWDKIQQEELALLDGMNKIPEFAAAYQVLKGQPSEDPTVAKRAALLKVLQGDPIAAASRMAALAEDYDLIKATFSPLSSEKIDSERSLIECAWALTALPEDVTFGPLSESFMTPTQRAIYAGRKEIQARATQVLNDFAKKFMEVECPLDYIDFHEVMKEFVQNRDKRHVTEQFHKDGHRYNILILEEMGKDPVLYPGKNTATEAKDSLLNQLKAWATHNGKLDPELYALLQEALCQNFQKLSIETRILHEVEKRFGDSKFAGLVLLSPKQEAIALTRLYENHFVVAHEYNVKVRLNWDMEHADTYRIRIECPIVNGKMKTPIWTLISHEEPGMVAEMKPVPLDKIDGKV
jgi:hypothetical protein